MRFVCPFVVLAFLSGCGDDDVSCGPGTMLVSGVCVVADFDAGDDGGGDAGVDADVGEGTLLISEDAPLRLVPGARLCLHGEVLRADGSLDRVELESVASDDDAIVRVADPLDCAGVGVVALSPGNVELTIAVGGLTAQVPALVAPGAIHVNVGEELVVGVDRTARLDVGAYATAESEGVTLTPGLHFAPSELELRVRDSSLASIRRGDEPGWPGQPAEYPQGYEITGLARGTGTIEVDYFGVAQEPTTLTIAGPAVVMGPPTLRYLRDSRQVYQPFVLAPGECVAVELWAGMRDDLGNEWSDRVDEPSWTLSGSIRMDGSGARISACGMTRGPGEIRGCTPDACALDGIAVYNEGEVEALEAVVDGFVSELFGAPAQRLCPNLRVHLRYADGSIADITESHALQWQTSFLHLWSAEEPLVVDGERYYEDGRPCFASYGIPAEIGEVGFKAAYGEVFFDVAIPVAR